MGHERCHCGARYEIDKLTASQRLDLNLEKGRMRDELQALRDKTNELEIKMDKETNSLKAAVEQTKNETIKYCLGMMLVSCKCWDIVAKHTISIYYCYS